MTLTLEIPTELGAKIADAAQTRGLSAEEFALEVLARTADESEVETAYLLSSEAMKARLLEAKNRTDGVTLEEARARLGI